MVLIFFNPPVAVYTFMCFNQRFEWEYLHYSSINIFSICQAVFQNKLNDAAFYILFFWNHKATARGVPEKYKSQT